MSSPIVLVTGGSRGIGRVVALAFAKKKYRVGLNFLKSDEQAKECAKSLEKLGSEFLLLKTDVRDPHQVKKMVDELMKRWGQIDVLVNNAGVTRDRTILKMTDEEWNEVIAANLSGAFWCLRECAKVMAEQKRGSIINVASILGVRGGIGTANYSASKAGLIGLTKSAAKELGRFQIKVNAILPGFHLTDMGSAVKKHLDKILAEHVLGRSTDLNELAEFVVTVAEQNSASGQIFNFDSRIV